MSFVRIARRNSRRGATTVEAALTLPILFAFLFAGWEFSWVNVVRNTMDVAAYEAAREGMLPGATNADCKARGEAFLNSVGVNGASVVVSPLVIDETTSEVTVNISVPYTSNSMGVAKFFTTGTINTQCRLTRELLPGMY